jgi:hypothetical protein
MIESDEENRAFGWGFIILMLTIALGIIFALAGRAFTAVILLVLGPIFFAIIVLIPVFFPEAEREKRKRAHISESPIIEKPSRKIYVGIVGVTFLFLAILFWMVQLQLVRTNEAIVIAVFTIIFQVILYGVTELARKR